MIDLHTHTLNSDGELLPAELWRRAQVRGYRFLGITYLVFLAVMMALIQHDYKRLLSYHAISQVGYMILGVGTAVPAGIIGGLGAAAFLSGYTVLSESALRRYKPWTVLFYASLFSAVACPTCGRTDPDLDILELARRADDVGLQLARAVR